MTPLYKETNSKTQTTEEAKIGTKFSPHESTETSLPDLFGH